MFQISEIVGANWLPLRSPLLRRSLSLLLLTLNLTHASPCLAQDRQADIQAIRQVVADWDAGWAEFDATLATRDYAADADWTNSFGESEKGQAAIYRHLAADFRTPGIRSRHSTPSIVTIRFVRSDVAVVSSYRETSGQRSQSGAVYPTRKTHDLRVLVERGGQWVIVSHLLMDEKEARR